MRHITTLVSAMTLLNGVSFAQYVPELPAPPPQNTPTVASGMQPQGNCDLLASNTLRVVYKGIVESGWGAAPAAHFTVIETLAHKSYSAKGDGALIPGTVVGVELRRDIPGQPAGVVDSILAMRPGEEAVMRMDHLFMMDASNYGDRRVCARFMAKAPQSGGSATPPYGTNFPATGQSSTVQPQGPADTPQQATGTPDQPHHPASTPDTARKTTNGTSQVSTKWEMGQDGRVRERIYVNGEEVMPPSLETIDPAPIRTNPETTRPGLSPAKPDIITQQDDSDDDTIVETPQSSPSSTIPMIPGLKPKADSGATSISGSSAGSPNTADSATSTISPEDSF